MSCEIVWRVGSISAGGGGRGAVAPQAGHKSVSIEPIS